jgi:hypothetical protein
MSYLGAHDPPSVRYTPRSGSILRPVRGFLFGRDRGAAFYSIMALSAFGQGGMKLDAVPGSPRLDGRCTLSSFASVSHTGRGRPFARRDARRFLRPCRARVPCHLPPISGPLECLDGSPRF